VCRSDPKLHDHGQEHLCPRDVFDVVCDELLVSQIHESRDVKGTLTVTVEEPRSVPLEGKPLSPAPGRDRTAGRWSRRPAGARSERSSWVRCGWGFEGDERPPAPARWGTARSEDAREVQRHRIGARSRPSTSDEVAIDRDMRNGLLSVSSPRRTAARRRGGARVPLASSKPATRATHDEIRGRPAGPPQTADNTHTARPRPWVFFGALMTPRRGGVVPGVGGLRWIQPAG